MKKSYSELIENGVDRVLDSASELQAEDIRLLDVSGSCDCLLYTSDAADE